MKFNSELSDAWLRISRTPDGRKLVEQLQAEQVAVVDAMLNWSQPEMLHALRGRGQLLRELLTPLLPKRG